jgi:hypothetical protein
MVKTERPTLAVGHCKLCSTRDLTCGVPARCTCMGTYFSPSIDLMAADSKPWSRCLCTEPAPLECTKESNMVSKFAAMRNVDID